MSWGKVKIGDIFNIEKGVLQSTKCTPGVYTFITAAEEWKTHDTYTHDCEALVFAAAASGSLGRTHYINGKFISSDLCFILTVKDVVRYPIDIKFYHFVFNSLKETIVKATKTGTSKEAINYSNLSNYKLYYFDLDQQQMWIDKLLKVDEIKYELLIELDQQKTYLQLLRHTILQEAVQGKLSKQDPTDEPASELLKRIRAEKAKGKVVENKGYELGPVRDEEKFFKAPLNWHWCRIGNITDCLDNIRRPIKKEFRNEGSIPYYGANGQVGWIDEYLFNEDLVLVVEDETFVGRTKPFSYVIKGKAWVNNHAHVLRPKGKISVDFLDILLCKYDFVPLTSGTTGRKKLTKQGLLTAAILLPPVAEQQRIVLKVQQLQMLISRLEAQVQQSRQYAQQLLQSVLKEAFEHTPKVRMIEEEVDHD